jgi:uncharacterized phosphosugar-binding protein
VGGAGAHPFLATVTELLRRLEEADRKALDEAAERILTTIQAGGLVHVAGTGHSTLFALEAFYRAGGLAAVNPIWHPALLPLAGGRVSTLAERTSGLADELIRAAGVRAGEVVAIFSHSGINPVPVELAEAARRAGAVVIAVVSLAHSRAMTSRHKQGRRLFEVADVVIDTGAPVGDASYRAPAAGATAMPVAPLSTLAGAYVWSAILARVADRAAERGYELPIWRSSNVPGGDEAAAGLLDRYGERVRAL